MCGLMTYGPRQGEVLPLLAGISSTYCARCAVIKDQEICDLRARKRAAALLAHPSPLAALLPDSPAPATEAEQMSYRIARNIVNRSPAPDGAFYTVHWILGMLADDNGYVSDRTQLDIARLARVSKATAIEALEWLEQHSQITIWRHHGQVNRYHLAADYLLDHEDQDQQ